MLTCRAVAMSQDGQGLKPATLLGPGLVPCTVPESFGVREMLRERLLYVSGSLGCGAPERRACLSPQEASEVTASTDASYRI